MIMIKHTKPHGIAAPEPTSGNAGVDLRASEEVAIDPGHTVLVSTGIKMAIPHGHYGAVCSRSGLAAKNSVAVLNAPGIVDSNYRGEIKIILHNFGEDTFFINVGDRIAQLVIMEHKTPVFHEVDGEEFEQLSTDRGEDGFGSSGVK